MIRKKTDTQDHRHCKHCGACEQHDRCDHCGYCRKCGVFVSPAIQMPPQIVPYYVPVPMYTEPYYRPPFITWTITGSNTGIGPDLTSLGAI